jgi:hypothetical protein
LTGIGLEASIMIAAVLYLAASVKSWWFTVSSRSVGWVQGFRDRVQAFDDLSVGVVERLPIRRADVAGVGDHLREEDRRPVLMSQARVGPPDRVVEEVVIHQPIMSLLMSAAMSQPFLATRTNCGYLKARLFAGEEGEAMVEPGGTRPGPGGLQDDRGHGCVVVAPMLRRLSQGRSDVEAVGILGSGEAEPRHWPS